MNVLLNTFSFSDDLITEYNANDVLVDFVTKFKYLTDINKKMENATDLKIYMGHDVYKNENYLSSKNKKNELAKKIEDDDTRGIFLALFTSYHCISFLDDQLGESTIDLLDKKIRHYKEFKLLDNSNMVISFSTDDIFSESEIIIDGENEFNVPSLVFCEKLNHIPRVSDFYLFFASNYKFTKGNDFNCFDQYEIMNFFFEDQDNFHRMSKILTHDQNRRLEIHPIIGDAFASINGFDFDPVITNNVISKSKRRIYKKKNLLISLDYQHFQFEKHNKKGVHLGVVDMFERGLGDAEPATHSLKFKG
jgi:hypothetical protein